MNDHAVIQVLGPAAISGDSGWTPTEGSELLEFLETVHPAAKEKVRLEASAVLGRCVRPGESGRRTGLVVGYVQSGKTTSFTAVAAAAKDNGYGLVIVVAGTSNNLLGQTRARLEKDLRIGQRGAWRRWKHIESPAPDSDEATDLLEALRPWTTADDQSQAADRASVLITVMKQWVHLSNLVSVLEHIGEEIDLNGVGVLVVDDEADQASPNTAKVGESTTFAQFRLLGEQLPTHTLLQYTATPQAPLLVSIASEFSPDFACVLDPGRGYTGGKWFFVEHEGSFVERIPPSDLAAIFGDEPDVPPKSLLAAFACFVLGAAGGYLNRADNRSMLVHPSQNTMPQKQMIDWIAAIRGRWIDMLSLEDDDEDKDFFLRSEVNPAYENLLKSVDALPPRDELLGIAKIVLPQIAIREVNAAGPSGAPSIDFADHFAWILVGGTLLDRGFTVEGLTVTYMPRGLGVGNADTLQQRARFFGYKEPYAGYCRAWLEHESAVAFKNYVVHEEHMRSELITVAAGNTSLRDWKRKFLLAKNLRPTRQSAIRLGINRNRFAGKFTPQDYFDPAESGLAEKNTGLVRSFEAANEFAPGSDEAPFVGIQLHESCRVELSMVLDTLLSEYEMFGDNDSLFTDIRLVLQEAVDRSDSANPLLCRVIKMSANEPNRERSMQSIPGKIPNLFQGANSGTGYPGDRGFYDEGIVTVQIHHLDLTLGDGLWRDVTALAIRVPEEIAHDVISGVS